MRKVSLGLLPNDLEEEMPRQFKLIKCRAGGTTAIFQRYPIVPDTSAWCWSQEWHNLSQNLLEIGQTLDSWVKYTVTCSLPSFDLLIYFILSIAQWEFCQRWSQLQCYGHCSHGCINLWPEGANLLRSQAAGGGNPQSTAPSPEQNNLVFQGEVREVGKVLGPFKESAKLLTGFFFFFPNTGHLCCL